MRLCACRPSSTNSAADTSTSGLSFASTPTGASFSSQSLDALQAFQHLVRAGGVSAA